MIALLSDTHGNVDATRRALDLLAPHAPTEYIHLGDVGSPEVVRAFTGLHARLLIGNNDYDIAGLAAAAGEARVSLHKTIELMSHGHRVFATHGHTRRMKDAVANRSYDAILFGHTHVPADEIAGVTRLINPGALYRAPRYSVALVDPVSLEVTFIDVPKR